MHIAPEELQRRLCFVNTNSIGLRNKLTTEVNGQLFNYFGDAVYRTVVPRNVRLAEAPSYGKPAIKYDKRSRGAIAYLALAGEMLRRYDEAAAGISRL